MKRTLVRIGALAALLTAVGVAAAATAPVVSVRLAGSHPRTSASCGDSKNLYAVVTKGSRVMIAGRITPKPHGPWRALVQVKHCVGGDFKTIWKRQTVGRADGTFQVAYLAAGTGLFAARTSYGKSPTVESRKLRFTVR